MPPYSQIIQGLFIPRLLLDVINVQSTGLSPSMVCPLEEHHTLSRVLDIATLLLGYPTFARRYL